MSGTLYEIYQNKIFTLAKTIVIKHEMVANLINKHLLSRGYYVDEINKRTWKYYMNLAGEYHQSDIDLLKAKYNTDYMVIKVAGDNRPTDAFFEKNLISGPSADLSTANEYRYGSHLYNNLIGRYPEMETLILGILNPIDIDVAIDARDGEILYCGGFKKQLNPIIPGTYHYTTTNQTIFVKENLVEPNETNFIPELQKWVDAVLSRWHIPDYNDLDNLYIPSVLAMLYTYLPKQISNIRLANAKLNTANTYHVKQFLSSHGNLGEIVDLFSPKEYLWVYRNFYWLESNLGKDQTFKSIIDNIFTPSNIPINGYRLKHNILHMPDVYRPESQMIKEAINFNQVGSGTANKSITNILSNEQHLGKSNAYELESVASEIQLGFDSAGNSVYETKVLESNVIDYTLRSPFPFADVLINNLIYAASHGYYKGTVYIDHPTKNERLQLTPLNAVVLLIYCFVYGFTGNRLIDIPEIMVRTIPRHKDGEKDLPDQKYPTLSDLYNLVGKSSVTSAEMESIYGGIYQQPIYTSTNNFYVTTLDIQKEMLRRYRVCARNENIKGRGYLARVMSQMYWLYVPCKLSVNNSKYENWFNTHGIDLGTLSRSGFIQFGYKLLSAATGEDTYKTVSMTEKQRAAINLLKHFSSYNIQIISTATETATTLLEGSNLRYSNMISKKKSLSKVPAPYLTVKQSYEIKSKIFIDMFTSRKSNYRTKKIAKVNINGDSFKVLKTDGKIRRFVNIKGLTVLGLKVINNVYDTKWYTSYPLLPVMGETVQHKFLNIDLAISENLPQTTISNRLVLRGKFSYTLMKSPEIKLNNTVTPTGGFWYET